MTQIRPGRDSNPVHMSFEQQPDVMSHRGRPPGLVILPDYVSRVRADNVEETALLLKKLRSKLICILFI